MRKKFLSALAWLALAGCTHSVAPRDPAPPIVVKIIAFNDFHGYLTPPKQAIELATPQGPVKVPAGGAPYFASAVAKLRAENPRNIVVTAGDLIGASPLVSSLFLDEPTIDAMNLIGVGLSALGNHEFDRGQGEILRMQTGGCAKLTARAPCQVDKDFQGASFSFLAANTVRQDGTTLFPAYAIRSFGEGVRTVRIGFIGMTLKGTADIVSAAGIQGLHFADEAATANALLPRMRAEGADVIVLLIHQGGSVTAPHGDRSCAGLEGDILPILDRLDPSIDIVISGHTHKDYVCDYGRINPARPFLLTSAGQYGTLLTDIDIALDPVSHKLLSKHADNLIVQGEPFVGATGPVPLTGRAPTFPAEPRVKALVDRYAAASTQFSSRLVGHVSGPVSRAPNAAGEQALGDLIADAQLAALSAPKYGRAQLAFMNPGGVRAELLPGPDGTVSFGAIYMIQPFGNPLVVKTYTGEQIRGLLEQQFTNSTAPKVLLPSANVRYSYDLSRPAGARVANLTIDGKPVETAARYRVGISMFLGDGGDAFSIFRQGTAPVVGPLDLDALEAYLGSGRISPPALDRIQRLDTP